jgi:hypothetical protein
MAGTAAFSPEKRMWHQRFESAGAKCVEISDRPLNRSESHAKTCRDESAGGDVDLIVQIADLVVPTAVVAVEGVTGVELQRGVLPPSGLLQRSYRNSDEG